MVILISSSFFCLSVARSLRDPLVDRGLRGTQVCGPEFESCSREHVDLCYDPKDARVCALCIAAIIQQKCESSSREHVGLCYDSRDARVCALCICALCIAAIIQQRCESYKITE